MYAGYGCMLFFTFFHEELNIIIEMVDVFVNHHGWVGGTKDVLKG